MSDRFGDMEIYVMDSDGTTTRRLGQIGWAPHWGGLA